MPHEGSDWARRGLRDSRTPFVKIAQAIAYSQPVYLLCRKKSDIDDLFCSKQNIIFIECDYNDTWTRDYAPLSADSSEGKVLLDFRFDGWGGKYEAELDDAVGRYLGKKGYFGTTPIKRVEFTLEGGSIECDGEGTVLTTSSCLCNPNRNGGLSKEEVEEVLRAHIGARRILWLDHGYLSGDDTDGHIDMLARFADRETILYIRCDDPSDEHYEELSLMEEQLASFRTAEGKPYKLVPLPMCDAAYGDEGKRMPLSYANFLISNKAVLYPTYGDRHDREAGDILRGSFPGREIIPIPSLSLSAEGGSLHCSTMQINY